MQLPLDLGQTRTMESVRNRLRRHFGTLHYTRRDPIGQLVKSIISGRTKDAVSGNAHTQLAQRYRDWNLLADAEPKDIQRIITRVTFSDAKAEWLSAALRIIRARTGALDLEFLRDWPVELALTWLENLPGVGRKVSASTLNFSTLHKPALVIDTHVLRVLQQLQFVPPSADAKIAFDIMMPTLADWSADDLSELHCLIKALGQTLCQYSITDCAARPLNTLCPHA
ncbi:MAG TPA: hypothetical protein VK779_05775 [Rhizomicrobium sp.]|jgi:endonuclease-3|nr:hypothetical protein [Rhizomicrobium sp.]